MDQTAEFACRVGGDPPPEILWRRHDGKMPIGRGHIMDDKSLRIERVMTTDQGTYICEAENSVGTKSANATLTVHCKISSFIKLHFLQLYNKSNSNFKSQIFILF